MNSPSPLGSGQAVPGSQLSESEPEQAKPFSPALPSQLVPSGCSAAQSASENMSENSQDCALSASNYPPPLPLDDGASQVPRFRPTPRDVISGIAPHVFDERKRRPRQPRRSSLPGWYHCDRRPRSSPLRMSVVLAEERFEVRGYGYRSKVIGMGSSVDIYFAAERNKMNVAPRPTSIIDIDLGIAFKSPLGPTKKPKKGVHGGISNVNLNSKPSRLSLGFTRTRSNTGGLSRQASKPIVSSSSSRSSSESSSSDSSSSSEGSDESSPSSSSEDVATSVATQPPSKSRWRRLPIIRGIMAIGKPSKSKLTRNQQTTKAA